MALLSRLAPKIGRTGIWSFVDQGGVSAGNFALTLVLARSLAPAEYGIFVVIYGVLLVLNTVHTSLVSYPLSVLGAHRNRAELKGTAGDSAVLTCLLGGVLYVSALVAVSVVGRPQLALIIFPLLIIWQIHETFRRALMAHLLHRAAIAGDFILYIGQVVLVLTIRRFGHLGVANSLGCVLVAATFGLLAHAAALGISWPSLARIRSALSASWYLGRWPLLSNAGYALTLQSLPWLLSRNGMAAAATFQALVNTAAIVNPISFSIGNLIIPAVALESLKKPAEDKGARLTMTYWAVGGVLLCPYFVLLGALPEKILRLFYGTHSAYSDNNAALRCIAAGFLLAFTAHVLASYFLGKKNTQRVLLSQVAGSLIAFVVALPAIQFLGVTGAAVAFLLMNLIRISVLLYRPVRSRLSGQHRQDNFVPADASIESRL